MKRKTDKEYLARLRISPEGFDAKNVSEWKRNAPGDYTVKFAKPLRASLGQRIMNRLNKPWLALLFLCAFIALCFYAYPVAPVASVPTMEQFIDQKLKEYKSHKKKESKRMTTEQAQQIIALFGAN